jgi:hypothetical protein
MRSILIFVCVKVNTAKPVIIHNFYEFQLSSLRYAKKMTSHVRRLRGIQKNLKDLTIEQLNDLLVHKTLRLLDLLDKKNVNGIEYRDIKLEVECIQEAINRKRYEKK